MRITGVAGAGAADVTIGDDTATVTISPDGDTATTSTSVSIGNAMRPEGDTGDTTKFNFAVTRTGDPGAFTVDVKTVESTLANAATEGKDYKAKTELALSFGATENTKMFTVDVIGDVEGEGDERFLVKLSNPQGATLGDDTGLGTIQDEASDDGGGDGGGDDGGDTGSLEITSPANKRASFEDTGGSGEITVRVTGDLEWTPVSSDSWIRNIKKSTGSSITPGVVDYVVSYSVEENYGDKPLDDQILIADEKFNVEVDWYEEYDECGNRVRATPNRSGNKRAGYGDPIGLPTAPPGDPSFGLGGVGEGSALGGGAGLATGPLSTIGGGGGSGGFGDLRLIGGAVGIVAISDEDDYPRRNCGPIGRLPSRRARRWVGTNQRGVSSRPELRMRRSTYR